MYTAADISGLQHHTIPFTVRGSSNPSKSLMHYSHTDTIHMFGFQISVAGRVGVRWRGGLVRRVKLGGAGWCVCSVRVARDLWVLSKGFSQGFVLPRTAMCSYCGLVIQLVCQCTVILRVYLRSHREHQHNLGVAGKSAISTRILSLFPLPAVCTESTGT